MSKKYRIFVIRQTTQIMVKKILTPLELKVMNVLWRLENAFIKDILSNWDEQPPPAYNTISTIVRILADKGFVGYEAHGRTHRYHPIISREDYQGDFLNNALKNVFKGSVSSLVSTLMDNGKVSDKDLADLKRLIGDEA